MLGETLDLDAILDNGDEIAKLMRPLYVLLLGAAADDAEDALGMDDLFDLDNPFVQEELQNLATMVRRVAETTKDEIRALVGRQAAEGWSADELAAEIEKLGEIRSVSRAQTIARTESAAGYSRGSIAAYRASGVVESTEWLLGPEPCPECDALGGKTAKLGEEFATGISFPPAHPACTCALAPVLKG